MKLSKTSIARVISIAAAWIFSMLVVLLIGLLILRLTLCNPNFLKKQILDSNYISAAEQEMEENFKSYGAAGGFESDVMLSLVNLDMLRNDLLSAVDLLYGQTAQEPDYTVYEEHAYQILTQNIAERNITMTDEITEGVRVLAQTCASDYAQRATIPFLSYLKPLILMVQKITFGAILGIIAASAMCLWLMFALHRNKRNGLAYTCQSLIAASVLSCAAPIALDLFLPVESLLLSPASLKLLLVTYVQNLFASIWPFSIAVVVVTAATCTVYAMKKTHF